MEESTRMAELGKTGGLKLKKRILVSTCVACCMLALAGCGSAKTDNKAATEIVESTEAMVSTEAAETTKSTEAMECTEAMETTESMESTEAMEATGSTEANGAVAWADGTYTEVATGKEGDFEVTVVIQGGCIASVTVGENQEAPDKGGVAIAQLPDKIVAAQSYEVDVVSGATVTSTGIKDDVAKALEKAAQ